MSNAGDKTRFWLEIFLFGVLGFLSIGMPLIPMGLSANSMPFPDLMFCLFAAWMIRRPSTAPTLLVVILAVAADALMMRPIGLWALALFAGTEVLRVSQKPFRDISFLIEWLYVSGLLAALLIAQNAILFLSFASVYDLSETVWHFIRTIAVYPLVVGILHWGFRIRVERKDDSPNRLGYVL